MRTPALKTDPDGNVITRVIVPASIWALSGEVSKEWGVTQAQALNIIMKQFASLVNDSNANVLGGMFKGAYQRLLAKDSVPLDGLPPIDASKLHRSARTKSGFTGIYANGQGFRAMARMLGEGRVQRSIGTFPTAERAAWARFLHYKKNNLPYGDVEAALDDHNGDVAYYREVLTKQLGRDPTDLELIAEVNEARSEVGATLLPVPEGVTLPEPQFSRRRLRERDQQQGS